MYSRMVLVRRILDIKKGVRNISCGTLRASKKVFNCTLIPGDGVGPELMHSLKGVFKAANVPIKFETTFISEINPEKSKPLDAVADSIRKNKLCIEGPIKVPRKSPTGELQSMHMKLRLKLDLYASVVHAKSIPGIESRHKDVDIILVREQTEGEYSAVEHESVKGVVECYKIMTAPKTERIAKFAFDYATKFKRKQVTAVHKANIMKLGDGLFLKSCKKIAKKYPKIKFSTIIVDNATMQAVSNPQQFDVLVTPNLYGSILNNLITGLVGGGSLVPGATYSRECVIFAPGIKLPQLKCTGHNVANPTAIILCGTYLLNHVGLQSECDMIKRAVYKVLRDRKVRTKDLGGEASTNEFTSAIIHNLKV